MIENYVAFDFETANGKTPCSIGVIEFLNGKVIDEYYSLINPKIEKFNPFTTRIHGIREEDVLDKPEFIEIWNEIKHFFEDKTIIAHNLSFDLSVLNYSLDRYNIQKPNINSYCTLRISRQLLELDNYKLNTLAKHYSIKQDNYHNALEDAFVCGKIFSNLILEMNDPYSFLNNDSYDNVNKKVQKPLVKPGIDSIVLTNQLVDLRLQFSNVFEVLSDKLKGETYVVSGVFESISRNELKKLIEDNGGRVGSSISSKTTCLIAGDKMGPSKRTKAEDLNIPIISEQEFLSKLS